MFIGLCCWRGCCCCEKWPHYLRIWPGRFYYSLLSAVVLSHIQLLYSSLHYIICMLSFSGNFAVYRLLFCQTANQHNNITDIITNIDRQHFKKFNTQLNVSNEKKIKQTDPSGENKYLKTSSAHKKWENILQFWEKIYKLGFLFLL